MNRIPPHPSASRMRSCEPHPASLPIEGCGAVHRYGTQNRGNRIPRIEVRTQTSKHDEIRGVRAALAHVSPRCPFSTERLRERCVRGQVVADADKPLTRLADPLPLLASRAGLRSAHQERRRP